MPARKTVVITGANSGIGLATAKILAIKGYNIVILCRDKSKGDRTVEDLLKINSAIRVENFSVDLSDLNAVQKVAQDIVNKYPVIDRLINNAGYYPATIEFIGDIEKTFVASHLGHMLLTLCLMPALDKSVEARIINVSSGLHSMGSFDRFFIRMESITSGQAYADAKLANVLFTRALSRHLPPHITTYSLHPGVVRTNFAKETSGIFGVLIRLFKLFFISAEQGAATSIYLTDINSQLIRPFAGYFFTRKKPKKLSHRDLSEQNENSLWNKSLTILDPYLNINNRAAYNS